MDEGKNLINIFKVIKENVDHLDDFLDKALAPFTEYIDTTGDIATPIKGLQKAYSLSRRLKFKGYLRAYSLKVNRGQLDDDYYKKLEDYIKIPKNLEIIAQIIDSAIEAKSVKSATVLGWYSGEILNDIRELNSRDLVAIEALKIMYDDDFKLFLKLYKYAENRDVFQANALGEMRVHDLQESLLLEGFQLFETEMLIEKLKGVLAIGYGVGGFDSTGNSWGAFKFNMNTSYLYEIIIKAVNEEAILRE